MCTRGKLGYNSHKVDGHYTEPDNSSIQLLISGCHSLSLPSSDDRRHTLVSSQLTYSVLKSRNVIRGKLRDGAYIVEDLTRHLNDYRPPRIVTISDVGISPCKDVCQLAWHKWVPSFCNGVHMVDNSPGTFALPGS